MPEGEISDTRPFLAIPYWMPGDSGEQRPLPGNVLWYMCPSIRTSTYQPGEILEVTVEVRNSGGSNTPSLAQVTLWWSNPTLGFVIQPENLIGFRQVAVEPQGGRATTTVMAKRMPDDAPDHICLLARVSHSLDPAPAVADPVGDRHWAQRNLSVVTPKAPGPVTVFFDVANPLKDAAPFTVRIAPATNPAALAEADQVVGEPSTDFAMIMSVDGHASERVLELGVDLEAGERRTMEAEITIFDHAPDSFVALEFSLLYNEQLMGGLGVVVLSP